MTTTVLTMVGILCLLAACHPFVTYPWSLIVLQALRPARPAGAGRSENRLSCAVCVCAYNEERVIARKVDNLLALRAQEPDLQILIYVDAASDRTAEILREYGGAIDLHVSAERHGKTYGMNLLAARAQAAVLIFTDANVIMDLACVRDFQRYFADPEIGCVCGNLVYTNPGDSTTASTGSTYWRFEEAVKKLEMESGSVMGADGSLFAIRRELHYPPPPHIIDDMYVSLMILCSGYRVIQASDAFAYEESVVSSREEFQRKIRIACQAFNVHRLVWPHLRQLDGVTLYKYVSHKLIRWFTIYLLAASAIAFDAALLASGHGILAAAGAAFGAAALLLGRFCSLPPFAQITEILSAFAGTGLGVWRSLRGDRYQTWTPAASIRK
ncbi:MAG: glycosyltransferase [Steroidobacteraceae bacterium]|jgi:cellulose synthase/poly-beta-1,6-N-acetylglucosamine synthase-like glycosyltransferase